MDRSTLLDIAKASDPNGMPARVIMNLGEMNEIVQDAPAYPSNAQMGNRVTVSNAMPTISTGKVNKGVTRSKGTTKQLVDSIGIFVGRSEIDLKLKKIIGEASFAAEKSRQNRMFQEALMQRIANELLYGDEAVDDAGFTGLAPRLDALATAITGPQVVSMGSVTNGDGTSIYVVDWGEDTCHLIYPRDGAGVAGLDIQNKLDQEGQDADGEPMRIDVALYDWFLGLAVKDDRHVARIANIDISDANVSSPTQGNLLDKLIDVLTMMPNPGASRRVLYTHRRIVAAFHKQALNRSNAALSIQDYLGRLTPHIWQYPIRALDQMSAAEGTVS